MVSSSKVTIVALKSCSYSLLFVELCQAGISHVEHLIQIHYMVRENIDDRPCPPVAKPISHAADNVYFNAFLLDFSRPTKTN